MESEVTSIIKLIENGKVIHTIKIENVQKYKFLFDSITLSTLHLIANTLKMRDLDILLNKPYEAYVVMGVKRTVQDGHEQYFEIPARVFKYIKVVENGERVKIHLYENMR